MMGSGKDRSLALLSILGDRAQTVLSKLSSQTAALLTSSIENSPNLSLKEKKQFLIQVLDDLDAKKMSSSSSFKPSTKFSGSLLGGGMDVEESSIQRDPTLRTPSMIARKLGEQKPQIRAFFLSRIDDAFRQEILSYMSDEAIADYESRKVQTIPLGDKIFAGLYEEICRKKDEDNEEEEMSSSSPFGGGASSSSSRKSDDDFAAQFSSFFS